MSRHVIGRLPSTFRNNQSSEDENEVETVFSDETLSVFPCYQLLPLKTRSIFDSARLGSTDLNGISKTGVAPIRRKDAELNRRDPFEQWRIPEFIITHMFSYLGNEDLCAAMETCKKFYTIGKSAPNWAFCDVANRPVDEISLAALMEKKTRSIRLTGAKTNPAPLLSDKRLTKCMFVSTRLTLLDLSRAFLTHRQLLIMLRPCRMLKCLSLEANSIDDTIANCVANNRNLEQLDISMTDGLTETGAFLIFSQCKKLEQLNAAWCGLNKSILHVILENISEKIEKVNFSGSIRNDGFDDEHMQMLTESCPLLTDIDMSDNVELTDMTIPMIMTRLRKLKSLGLSRCYGIDPNVIVRLNEMHSLEYLNVHNCVTDSNLALFRDMCSKLQINTSIFNYTAQLPSNSALWRLKSRRSI